MQNQMPQVKMPPAAVVVAVAQSCNLLVILAAYCGVRFFNWRLLALTGSLIGAFLTGFGSLVAFA